MFALTQAPPFLAEVTPSRGTPAQTGERAFPATEVVIRGRNIGGAETKIFFNDIEAPITANLGNEIFTRVPDSATSGKIFVKKSGGECLPDSNTGVNCSATDFFVDCYLPYNEEYKKEIEVKWGETVKYEFEGAETRAFLGNLNEKPSGSSAALRINCPGPTTIRYFSPSCQIGERVLVRDPLIDLGDVKIVQFFVTAGDSECNISLN